MSILFAKVDWGHGHYLSTKECNTVYMYLLLIGSEERGVLEGEGIPVAILPSCQNMENIA